MIKEKTVPYGFDLGKQTYFSYDTPYGSLNFQIIPAGLMRKR